MSICIGYKAVYCNFLFSIHRTNILALTPNLISIFSYIYKELFFSESSKQSINEHDHQALFKINLYKSDLEPVDGAAVDEGGKHPDPVPEVVSNRREGQNHVEVPSYPLNEHVVHVEWGHLHLKVLLQGQLLHLEASREKCIIYEIIYTGVR